MASHKSKEICESLLIQAEKTYYDFFLDVATFREAHHDSIYLKYLPIHHL